jgi:hypothetical protein
LALPLQQSALIWRAASAASDLSSDPQPLPQDPSAVLFPALRLLKGATDCNYTGRLNLYSLARDSGQCLSQSWSLVC